MNKKLKALKVCNFLAKHYKIQRHLKEPFKVLVTTILSQRTREENTAKAVKQLFKVASTPAEILSLNKKKLEQLIKPAGFFRVKAKKLKEICKILLEKYEGKVPKTRAELIKLPGVGFKTADVLLCYCFGKPRIAVDVHVEVCSKRLGLVSEKVKDYEIIRRKLEQLFPENKRWLVNRGLVLFGREFCSTNKPKCRICPLKDLCSYKNKNL